MCTGYKRQQGTHGVQLDGDLAEFDRQSVLLLVELGGPDTGLFCRVFQLLDAGVEAASEGDRETPSVSMSGDTQCSNIDWWIWLRNTVELLNMSPVQIRN